MVASEVLYAAARLLMGGYFAFSGLNHFMMPDDLAGWIRSKGLPAPEALVYVSGGLLIAGGIGVVTGAAPVASWGALTLFLLVVTPVFHDFWNMEGDERQQNMINFLKNIALIGGLLFFAAAVESGTFGRVFLSLSLIG
ncbi:MAG: DoxX family protein [Candidatus Nanohaloarchaea archaeon]